MLWVNGKPSCSLSNFKLFKMLRSLNVLNKKIEIIKPYRDRFVAKFAYSSNRWFCLTIFSDIYSWIKMEIVCQIRIFKAWIIFNETCSWNRSGFRSYNHDRHLERAVYFWVKQKKWKTENKIFLWKLHSIFIHRRTTVIHFFWFYWFKQTFVGNAS